jgi:oligopeptide transport system substrate-binding protein
MQFLPNALFWNKRAFRFSLTTSLLFSVYALLSTGCTREQTRADLVILNGAEPESLDPAIITGQAEMRIVHALFEGLVRLDPRTAQAVPGLAERWERSPDELTYTFHLRSNTVWSTGEPLTADDVVYSWRRLLDPKTAAEYAGALYYLKNGEAFNTGKITDVSQVGLRALDGRTFQAELASPTAFFIELCAIPALEVVPRQTIEQHGDGWLKSRPLPTSGPYQLEEWRIHDKIRLRKNPRYWDGAQTQTELVDLLPVESANLAMNLYKNKQADIIWDKTLIPTELMDVLSGRPDCHIFNYLGTYFFRFNVTRKPLDDVRVRKAFALTVDKKRIVEKITRGGEEVAHHITPKGIANYEPPQGLPYDPDQARRLLAEAGYPGGKGFPPLQYLLNAKKLSEQIAIELQEMWRRELGIKIELRQMEWKVYLATQGELDYDLSASSWIGDYNDANNFLDLWMINNGNNRTGWKNAKYDELLREGNMQTDLRRRAKVLQAAESLLVQDEAPIVPLFFYRGITFFDDQKIEGIYFNLLDEHPLNAIKRRTK